ncbi:MAG TPA: phosphatase PAP2 family protein, partial [Thermoanaerobaculia bacterium]|nr:phosphatase PAP2 family protein [Thermoanaerobaculia bacterium]
MIPVRSAVTAGIAATIAVTLLFRATSLDVELQSLAYDPATSGWPHAARFPWKQLHDFGTIPGLLLALGAIAVIAAGFLRPRFARWRFPALYIVVLTALGPGVITNLFGKILAGRPRPEEVVEFGGTLRFLEPFEPGTPGKGFSFLCGHCSMGYLFVAFFFLLRGRARWLALAASSAYGLLLGAARVADGAHFPSDVTLAGTITFTLAAALAPLARMQVSREAWERRGKLAVAAGAAAIALLVFFSFSTPVNRERVHTWIGAPRRAATHETLLPWDRARTLIVDVERGDVRV